ncbi:hypothetical protein A3SI_05472 [Nitritalea halalkaliphila LW7]|uniref:Uncharacterized protein n=2 Tax=Nitritalea TaxID=1187887 RepID=I5C7T9_9BACT|nr:hypothetical protein A3SI_05472 [Nitritalea halalkaliphila LW7]
MLATGQIEETDVAKAVQQYKKSEARDQERYGKGPKGVTAKGERSGKPGFKAEKATEKEAAPRTYVGRDKQERPVFGEAKEGKGKRKPFKETKGRGSVTEEQERLPMTSRVSKRSVIRHRRPHCVSINLSLTRGFVPEGRRIR